MRPSLYGKVTVMPRTKRAATAAACALGVAAAMTATAQPAAAAAHATASYTCYANYPVNFTTRPMWDFYRSAGGSLRIDTSLATTAYVSPSNSTGSLVWGPTPSITGVDPYDGVGAPVHMDGASVPTLPSAPERVDLTWIAWGTTTSCYLTPGSATGFPI